MGLFVLKHIFSTILSIINITRLSNQGKGLEILIFAALVIGKNMSRLPNDASKITPPAIYMTIGTLTMLAIITRLIARRCLPQPAHAAAGNAFLNWLGRFVHYALYILVLLMVISGISISLQTRLMPVVFGGSGTPLPADFYDFTARMLHDFVAPALLVTVLLHTGAALYHQFTLKDHVLARMWYGK